MRPTDLLVWLALGACGGSPASPPQAASRADSPPPPGSAPPPDSAAADPPADPAPVAGALPTTCSGPSADLCAPPGSFVDRLCPKPHQDIALALFTKHSPFTRLYLKGKVDELAFDEEVLLLRFHEQKKGGMIVGSGNGTYDVLRWDGSCATGVEAEVFTHARPPKPRAAHIQWHRVGEKTQTALIAGSDAVKRAHARRGRECKGAMTGDVSAACEKADAALVEAIADYVRADGALPPPDPP